MLKSLGLWKTTAAVPAVKLADGEYTIENGQLKPVNPAKESDSSGTSTRKASDLQRLVEESEETAEEVEVPRSPSVDGERKQSNASDISNIVSVTEIHPLNQPLQSVRLS